MRRAQSSSDLETKKAAELLFLPDPLLLVRFARSSARSNAPLNPLRIPPASRPHSAQAWSSERPCPHLLPHTPSQFDLGALVLYLLSKVGVAREAA